MTDRVIDPNQWYDPSLAIIANGNLEWARWATKYLYENIARPEDKSQDWSKRGIITQFELGLDFNCPNSTPVEGLFETNNRNWILLQRAVAAVAANGTLLGNQLFRLSLYVPPTTYLINNQPISNTYGSGEFPRILLMPEEWTANVQRIFSVTNNSGQAAVVSLSHTFLQVRTN